MPIPYFNFNGREIREGDVYLFRDLLNEEYELTVSYDPDVGGRPFIQTDNPRIYFDSNDGTNIGTEVHSVRAVRLLSRGDDSPDYAGLQEWSQSRDRIIYERLEPGRERGVEYEEPTEDFQPLPQSIWLYPCGTVFTLVSGSRVKLLETGVLQLTYSADGHQEVGYNYTKHDARGWHDNARIRVASLYDPSLEYYLTGGL
jgi:hypothetical protein